MVNPRRISWFTLLALVWTGLFIFIYHFPVWLILLVPALLLLLVGLFDCLFCVDKVDDLSFYLFGIKDMIRSVFAFIFLALSGVCLSYFLGCLGCIVDPFKYDYTRFFYEEAVPLIRESLPYVYLPSMLVPFLISNSIVKEVEHAATKT